MTTIEYSAYPRPVIYDKEESPILQHEVLEHFELEAVKVRFAVEASRPAETRMSGAMARYFKVVIAFSASFAILGFLSLVASVAVAVYSMIVPSLFVLLAFLVVGIVAVYVRRTAQDAYEK